MNSRPRFSPPRGPWYCNHWGATGLRKWLCRLGCRLVSTDLDADYSGERHRGPANRGSIQGHRYVWGWQHPGPDQLDIVDSIPALGCDGERSRRDERVGGRTRAANRNHYSAVRGAGRDSIVVAVTAATLTSLTITPGAASIPMSTYQQFTAAGNFSDGTTQNLTAQVT